LAENRTQMTVNDKTALVILAPGAEEMEVTIVVDVLRRAGVKVTLAGLPGSAAVTCSRGLRIVPDVALGDVAGTFDAVVLPGGAQGAENLANSPLVGRHLKNQWQRGRLVAAICAGPIALARHEIGLGETITSHPSVASSLQGSYVVSSERVVESGALVTSQGPGTSFEFALTLVRRLRGPDIERQVAEPMLLPPRVGDR
jgi:protein DJ-1